ncbi:MAG: phosphate ABC transporter substrate-binding protein PstS [Thermoplasmata archaeon]|nr:phosphate ABC transporter substrate-binding protein PstS [Thermoplasmata archaeon]MCI4338196.1 phosphate ABC transporter substrate-binding protein PstS [Thermoplasmata archaeon]
MSSASSTPPPADTIAPTKSSRTGLYAVVAIIVIVVIILAAGYAAGWFKAASKSGGTKGACTPPGSVPLLGAGSSFVDPLMVNWESVYTQSSVNYQEPGSGAGIAQISAKTIDYGASDAPLTAAQAANASGLLTIPETAGAVSIIYNLPGVNARLQISGPVLAQIYQGSITAWNDPAITSINPNITAMPSNAIVVVHRSDGSGTSYAFTDFLSKSSASWASGPGKSTLPAWPTGLGEHGSSGVANTVGTTPYAVGYVDLTYALNQGISFAQVQNPAGQYVVPNLRDAALAVAAGDMALPTGGASWSNVSLINEPGAGTYPVATFSYMLVYKDLSGAYGSTYTLQKAENLVDWLNWTVTYGQSYSSTNYYVTLPAGVVTADQQTIDSMTYNGASISICTLQN